MNRLFRTITGVLLAAALLLLSGCGLTVDSVMDVIAPSETPAPGSDLVFSNEETVEVEPLSFTYTDMDGLFCPFWASADGDLLVVRLTQLFLPEVAEITSLANEDGSTTVTIRLAEGLTDSDGEALDADDLLFTYYVLMDKDYDGPYEIGTLPIRGLPAYWNGMDMDMYGKYIYLYDTIYNSGRYDQDLIDALEKARNDAINSGVSEADLPRNAAVKAAQAALDDYDTDRADEIRQAMDAAWRQDALDIVEYTIDNYSGSIALRTPFTREEVLSSPGLQVAYAMMDRGYGEFGEDGTFTSGSGTTWDLVTAFPSAEDLYNETYAAFDGDAEQYWQLEGIGRPSMLAAVENEMVKRWAPADEDWRGTVDSVEGVVKTDPLTLSVTLEYCDDDMLSILGNVCLVPMRFYGDEALFDPDADSFGFARGNLRAVRMLAASAFGGGEYVYRETDIRTVYLDVNEHYWQGASEVPYVILTRES